QQQRGYSEAEGERGHTPGSIFCNGAKEQRDRLRLGADLIGRAGTTVLNRSWIWSLRSTRRNVFGYCRWIPAWTTQTTPTSCCRLLSRTWSRGRVLCSRIDT